MPNKTRASLAVLIALAIMVPLTAQGGESIPIPKPRPVVHIGPLKNQVYAIPRWVKEAPADKQNLLCMLLNLYYEARGEPKNGMEGAAYVTDSRDKVADPYLGKNICENVFLRTRVHGKWHCEFSWVCDKRIRPSLADILNALGDNPNLMWVTTAQINGTYKPPPELVGALYYYWPKGSDASGRAFFASLRCQIKLGHHWFCSDKKKKVHPQSLASN